MMAEKNLAPEAGAEGELTLERVNVAPAQTWNRLRTNDITLTVPAPGRKGDVYFSLPRLFEGVECGMGRAVTDWVESQAKGARYVEVGRGERREEPIVVAVGAGEVADTGVMVRAGAEATIVVAAGDLTKVTGSSVRSGTSASLLRVIVEAGARVHLHEYVRVGSDQQHLESVGISAARDARVDVHQYLLGGGTVALGLACDLAGERARVDLGCRYHAGGTEVLDINEVVRQRGRNTRSELSYNGVLEDAAKKGLRTTIDLVHGAKGAQGNEAETVLVLGDDVVNKTLPTILCDEDDVAGNHGATIGSVSPEQLAYLADRGLTTKEAEALFRRAIVDDAANTLPGHAPAAVISWAREALGAETAVEIADALELGQDANHEGSTPEEA